MKRKDYLLEKLSNEEKLYLKTLIVNVRRKYIRDNYRFINGKILDYSELNLEDSESIFDTLIKKFDKELKSAIEFEKLISNEKLYKIVRALSLKEKMMLFYLYKEQKDICEVAKIMNISLATAYRLKNQTLDLIMKNFIGRIWRWYLIILN